MPSAAYLRNRLDILAAIKRAADSLMRQRDSFSLRALHYAAMQLAALLKLPASGRKISKPAPAAHVIAELYLTAYKLNAAPTRENLAALLTGIARFELCLFQASQARTPTLMSPTVRAPEPNPPRIHTVPCGALDWQTSPPISTPPDAVYSQRRAEHLEITRDSHRPTRTRAKAAYAKRVQSRQAKQEVSPVLKKSYNPVITGKALGYTLLSLSN